MLFIADSIPLLESVEVFPGDVNLPSPVDVCDSTLLAVFGIGLLADLQLLADLFDVQVLLLAGRCYCQVAKVFLEDILHSLLNTLRYDFFKFHNFVNSFPSLIYLQN